MWSFWDSLESVSKFYSRVQISIIVFGLLTLMASIMAYIASQRINYLQTEEQKTMKRKLEITEQEAQSAKMRAEEAKQKAIETDTKHAPRRLSVHQRETIVKLMGKYKGAQLRIWANLGDNESVVYQKDFVIALEAAGWQVNSVCCQGFLPDIPLGLHLGIKDQNDPPPGAVALVELLKQLGIQINTFKLGIQSSFFERPNMDPNVILMIVGRRQ